MANHEVERLHCLVGGTIIGVEEDGEWRGKEFTRLLVMTPSGSVLACTILADEEGNAPGTLDILVSVR